MEKPHGSDSILGKRSAQNLTETNLDEGSFSKKQKVQATEEQEQTNALKDFLEQEIQKDFPDMLAPTSQSLNINQDILQEQPVLPTPLIALNQTTPVNIPAAELDNTKKKKCAYPGCSYATKNKGHLVAHIRTHTDEKPFKCTHEGCTFATAQNSSLKTHLRNHTGQKPFKCTFEGCNYAAKQQGHLQSHMRTHTGEKPYKCDYLNCNYAATVSSALNDHLKTHTGARPHQCTHRDCDFATITSSHLKKHMIEKHISLNLQEFESTPVISAVNESTANPLPSLVEEAEQEKDGAHTLATEQTDEQPHSIPMSTTLNVALAKSKHACTFEGCTYVPTQSGNLKRHILSHTDERPYKCTHRGCTYAANQSGSLISHLLIHTGEKPYKCTHEGCTYAARQSGDLAKHITNHTGQKPYRCTYCDFGAVQKEHLTKHLSSTHRYLLSGEEEQEKNNEENMEE